MAITRKPKAQETSPIDVEALINKGGSVATERRVEPDAASIAITLRVPGKLLTQIDKALEHKPIKTPRHTWLLEAVVEKLQRESR